MNGFRELVMDLCAVFEMPAPAFTENSASIDLNNIGLTISYIGDNLHFSALIGALPEHSARREEVTRKLLQGSLGILRSHSVLIHLKSKQGQNFVATEFNIPKTEMHAHNIKSSFNDYRAITAAVKDIITGVEQPKFGIYPSFGSSDITDDAEFVFRP